MKIKYVSVKEAAKICGRCDETIRRWIRQGKIPAEQFMREYSIRYLDIPTMYRNRQGKTAT